MEQASSQDIGGGESGLDGIGDIECDEGLSDVCFSDQQCEFSEGYSVGPEPAYGFGVDFGEADDDGAGSWGRRGSVFLHGERTWELGRCLGLWRQPSSWCTYVK